MADAPHPVAERLDAFMARANAAYYTARDPFRDFTTSPEITQVFGEILGLWAAVTWELIRRPDPVLLVELGPGRGTLMADALRAISAVAPAFRAALQLHLVEASPRLRAAQAERLTGATWHDSVDTLPEGPLLLLANEFLDALPIRQFVRRGGGWAERYVADGRFVETKAAPPLPKGTGWAEGAVAELNEPARAIAHAIGLRLTRHPGAALFLDYGAEPSAAGDTLQGISDGLPTNPLAAPPGTADVTAHVDFAAFAAAAEGAGARTEGPLPQGVLLTRLGLFQRTDRLARTQPPAHALALIDAARRLAEPNRMGRLFKAMAICSRDTPPLPGFAA